MNMRVQQIKSQIRVVASEGFYFSIYLKKTLFGLAPTEAISIAILGILLSLARTLDTTVKCVLCHDFCVRITFHNTNLHAVTNSTFRNTNLHTVTNSTFRNTNLHAVTLYIPQY